MVPDIEDMSIFALDQITTATRAIEAALNDEEVNLNDC